MNNLKNELKNNIFRSCYLFYGDENYLKKRYELTIIKKIITPSTQAMNLDVFADKSRAVSDVIDASETLPFMSDKRLIIVRNSELFKAGRKDDSDILADYIAKIPETSLLLFIENTIDKRNKLYKEVNKNGLAVEFKKLAEKDLAEWIKKSFKKLGNDIDSKTSVYLIRCVGNDMQTIEKEVNKLADFKGINTSISISDIDTVTTKSLQSKIFDLVSAIGNKKTEAAIELYNNLLMLKESPFMVLTMITRQFRIMLLCSSLLKDGFDSSEIPKKIGQHPFVVREALKESKNFRIDILKEAMSDCLSTDVSIKTGKMNDKLAVELLILKYCIGDMYV